MTYGLYPERRIRFLVPRIPLPAPNVSTDDAHYSYIDITSTTTTRFYQILQAKSKLLQRLNNLNSQLGIPPSILNTGLNLPPLNDTSIQLSKFE